jgi:hypothetical protein
MNWRGKEAMMKHILAVVAALAGTYPATAQNVIPPAEYDFPYKAKLTIERTNSQTDIRGRCPYSPFPFLLGCARSAMDVCYILMMDDDFLNKMNYPPGIVLRHEMGHCNGWPGHHPGARRP